MQTQLAQIVAQQPYPLVFATISGSHLYGFSSPDSDYDLRGVHLLPLGELVGLRPGQETIEISEQRPELELDLVTHELKKFMGLMLKRNGYVLEQLLSPLVIHTSETQRIKKPRPRLPDKTSQPPLPWICPNPMATLYPEQPA
jgi:uncharacterized protein